MKRFRVRRQLWIPGLMAALLLLWGTSSQARIQGLYGPDFGNSFAFTAKPGHILTSDGDVMLMWGYAPDNGLMQYPGPTLILNEDTTVTITLRNQLPPEAGNVSMVFPGQTVTASGGVQGLLTREARQTDNPNTAGVDESAVVYTITPTEPGTYLYRSGTRPDLQVEMGLVGAIIVRPAGYQDNDHNLDGSPNLSHRAYASTDTYFGHEFLYLVTEMDVQIHRYVEAGQWHLIDTSDYFATNWFVNGRNFPDLMAAPNVPWLPTQPYNCQPRMHVGDTVLIRMIGAGRDQHPMHYHGNDFETIAVDGRVLSSDISDNGAAMGPDLEWKASTIKSVPGQTVDLLWTWTGERLGWDIYGHETTDTSSGCTEYFSTRQALIDAGIPAADIPYDLDQYRDGGVIEIAINQLLAPSVIFDTLNKEFCPDHGVPFPVIIPPRDDLSFGPFYTGSPFLGLMGDLPPSHPGLNAYGGYFYMWHSHTEKELTSNDIWPGGLVTFMIVEPPNVPID